MLTLDDSAGCLAAVPALWQQITECDIVIAHPELNGALIALLVDNMIDHARRGGSNMAGL